MHRNAGFQSPRRRAELTLKTAVEVGETMQVLVPVGTPRLQTLTHLELLRSLKKSALSLVDTEFSSLTTPPQQQSQAPAEPLPHPYLSKNESKKSELLPPFK